MSDEQQLPATPSFFDRFLQEQNIKWMLGIGTTLLLASSLMLVTTHWNEAGYTPFWKYLTLLGYFALMFAASQWAYHKSALRKTGTVLMAVSLLLVPVSFLGLRWLHGQQASGLALSFADVLALAVNIGFCTLVSDCILRHFLRERQPTFGVCFLALSIAGAVLPGVPSHTTVAGAALTSLVLWLLFAVGTIKVNRHVFWLVEQRQVPRICGFFPILLLGGQFLLLFTLDCAAHVAREWWGLGCTLTAIPILLTADAVAGVFQQRTGNLVRPWPLAVGIPLLAGLLLSVVGVCLAGTGLRPPQQIPLAFVPTAALAALTMGVAARRTGHSGLVWAMLALLTAAYNFSYVFFRTAAAYLLQQGALAVHEPRLPLAFYGITYLPLLSALLGAAWYAERRGSRVFAGPLRACCALLPLVLLALGCTHPKAPLPVGLVLTAFAGWQTVVFRDRRVIWLGIAAWLVAAAGAAPFARLMWGWQLPDDAALVSLAVAGFTLLVPGMFIDRWADRLSNGPRRAAAGTSFELQIQSGEREPCQRIGCLVSLLLAAAWLLRYGWPLGPHAWPAAAAIGVLLVVHALRWARPELGSMAWLFAAVAAIDIAVEPYLQWGYLVNGATAVLLLQWCAGRWLLRSPQWHVSRAFGPVFKTTGFVGCALLLIGLCLPQAALETLFPSPMQWLPGPATAGLVWPCRLLLVGCALFAAVQTGRPWLTRFATVTVLALLGASVMSLWGAAAFRWLPAVWSGAALLGQVVVHAVGARYAADTERRTRLSRTVVGPVDMAYLATQTLIAVASLGVFAWPLRVAAGLAIVGIAAAARRLDEPALRPVALILLNWHVLLLPLCVFCPGLDHIGMLTLEHLRHAALPIALLATGSLFCWQRRPTPASQELNDFHLAQLLLLRTVIAGMLGVSLLAPQLSLAGMCCAALVFLLATGSELLAACQLQQAERVWSADAIAGAGLAYLIYFGWIRIDQGAGMFAAVGAAVLLRALAYLAERRPTTKILARPFEETSLVMPAVAVGLGVVRHATSVAPHWLGANSLALLLAAAVYFWHGLEQRQPRWHLAAAAIVNIALTLLWRELQLSDPQFYMIPLGASILALVQLLKRDVPRAWHDPLNYLGALVILVSPTFHIVGGSWLHLVTLMVAAVAIAVLAIGLQVRALLYAGTAFLVADLASMVVRGSVDHPNLLWVAGLTMGSAVVALAAVCENNREKLLQRLRIVSAALQEWD